MVHVGRRQRGLHPQPLCPLPRRIGHPAGLDGEVLTDPDMLAAEPDPKSRIKAARFIGYSVSAGTVLTVVAWRDERGELHGINAWKTSGAELRRYQEDR